MSNAELPVSSQDAGQWLTSSVLPRFLEPGESVLAVGMAEFAEGDVEACFAGIRNDRGEQVPALIKGLHNVFVAMTSHRIFLMPGRVDVRKQHGQHNILDGVTSIRWQAVRKVAIPSALGQLSYVNLLVPSRFQPGELYANKLQFWNKEDGVASQRHLHEAGPGIVRDRVAAAEAAGLKSNTIYEVLSTERQTDRPDLEAIYAQGKAISAAKEAELAARKAAGPAKSRSAAAGFALAGVLGILLAGALVFNAIDKELNVLGVGLSGAPALVGVFLLIGAKKRLP